MVWVSGSTINAMATSANRDTVATGTKHGVRNVRDPSGLKNALSV